MVEIDPDSETVGDPPTTAGSIEDQYLTERGGVNLRAEAVTVKGRAKQWEDAVEAFEDYVWRQWKAADTWRDEKGIDPTSHRFGESAAKDRYGRTLGVDRAARKLWGDALTTVHVVRRARPFGVNGQPQPPADHLDDLLDGNAAVYAAYRRHIEENHGRTYARLTVLEPHQNGYAHLHDGLWIEDPERTICEMDIEPAVDAHLDAVPQAQPHNHGAGTVHVRHDPKGRGAAFGSNGIDGDGVPQSGALPRELTKFLPAFADSTPSSERNRTAPPVLDADRGPLRYYALLWARGLRQWRPDQSVFPRLVNASQQWFGEAPEDGETDDEVFVSPEDMATHSGVETVDVSARPTDFERFESDGSTG